MKSGISTKIRYNINKDIVVCVVTPEKYPIPKMHIRHMIIAATNAGLSVLKELYPRYNKIPSEFKGVARLKDNDVHNLTLAKKIARKKAMRKMYKTYFNYMNLATKYFGMALGRYLEATIALVDKATEIDNEIVKLTSDESQS